MAASGTFTTSVANAYMTKYAKLVVDCIPKASGEFNQIPVETVKSDRFEWKLKVANSTSMGNTVEAAAFQPANSPSVVTTYSGFTIFHGNYSLSDVAKHVVDGSETNFFNAMNFLSEDAMDGALLYREGFLYGAGTAEVGTVASTNSTTNVRILPYASGRSINSSVLLMDGGVYEVKTSTLAESRGFFTISYRNATPQTSNTSYDVVVPSFPSGTTAGDRIFWVGTGTTTSYGLAPQGLDSLIDNTVSGSFQGVDFTTSTSAQKWVSTVLGNSGTLRALSPTILMNALQAQAEVFTGRSIDSVGRNLKWIAHPSQALPFYNMFPGSAQAATPMVTRPEDSKVGNMSRTFMGPLGEISLNFRRECPPSTIYGVDYSNIVNAERIKLDWRDKNVFMLNPNSANSLAQLYGANQLCIKERRHMVKIADLTYTISNGNRG